MEEAIGLLIVSGRFCYLMKIFGEMRYEKGAKDKHEEILRTLLTPARYDAMKIDCYPPLEIKLRGQLIVEIKVVECMHKKTEIKFIEEK